MATPTVEPQPTALGGFPIPPTILPQAAPSTYLLSHLISPTQLRPCGRLPSLPRPINLNTSSLNNANGSALVRLGNTSVVCGVRAEVLDIRDLANYRPPDQAVSIAATARASHDRPFSDSSQDGTSEVDSEIRQHSLLVPNVELQTGASPLSPYQPSSGAPSHLAQSLTQRLLSVLHALQLVDGSNLRIYSTDLSPEDSHADGPVEDANQILKGYWTIYLDILVLSHDGSIFDASFMAVVAALRDTVFPRAWFDPDQDRIFCSPLIEECNRLRLRIEAPVALSWKVFVSDEEGKGQGHKAKWILLDSDALEEDSGSCREGGTVVVDRRRGLSNASSNGTGEKLVILKLERNGGPIVGEAELREILQVADDRWSQWNQILKTASKS